MNMSRYKKSGWFNESHRHSLARKGIKTGRANKLKWSSIYDTPYERIEKEFKKSYGKKPTSQEMSDIALEGSFGPDYASSSLSSIDLGDGYSIVAHSESTRNGFRHIAVLMRGGQEVARAKIPYQNRTWESYEYQSVMEKLVDDNFEGEEQKKLIEKLKNRPADYAKFTNTSIGDAFFSGEKKGTSNSMKIVSKGDKTLLVGYGHAVYAERDNNTHIVTFFKGWDKYSPTTSKQLSQTRLRNVENVSDKAPSMTDYAKGDYEVYTPVTQETTVTYKKSEDKKPLLQKGWIKRGLDKEEKLAKSTGRGIVTVGKGVAKGTAKALGFFGSIVKEGINYSKKHNLTIEPVYVPRGSGNNPDGGSRDLKYKIKEWGYIFGSKKEAEKYANEHKILSSGEIVRRGK